MRAGVLLPLSEPDALPPASDTGPTARVQGVEKSCGLWGAEGGKEPSQPFSFGLAVKEGAHLLGGPRTQSCWPWEKAARWDQGSAQHVLLGSVWSFQGKPCLSPPKPGGSTSVHPSANGADSPLCPAGQSHFPSCRPTSLLGLSRGPVQAWGSTLVTRAR